MITEESFIDFECPYCGGAVSFPQINAKSLQACPSCLEALIVPETTGEVGRKIPIPITTPRLILRRLQGGDWKDLLELLSKEEMFAHSNRGPMEEQEIVRWLETDGSVKLTTPNEAFFLGIQVQDSGKLIGYVRLDFTDERLQALVSACVSPSYQRNGIATEAVSALLDFCFNEISLHRVQTRCDNRDVAARRLCEKVGLRREGESLKDRFVKGEWISHVWYARLDEEHRAERSGNTPESAA